MYIKALRDTLHFKLIFMPRIWEVPNRQLDRFQRQERRRKTEVSTGVTTQFYGNHYHTVGINNCMNYLCLSYETCISCSRLHSYCIVIA